MVRGDLEAESERGAVEKIRQMGYWVVRLKQTAAARERVNWYQFLARGYLSFIFHRVNAKALAIWYRSLSDLLDAGMNLHEAALTLAQRCSNRTLRQVTREIAEQALRGEPMSPALERYPSVFPLYAKALVQTGEESGLLHDTLEQLATFHDRIYELQMAFRLETFYPKIVLFMFLVIPPIIQAVAGSSQAGHLVFNWRVYLSTLIGNTGGIALGLIGFWLGWRLLMQFAPLRQGWGRVKLLLPGIGGIVRRTSLARWARSMAMLLRAGVPLRRGVEASASATGNEAMAAAILAQVPHVLGGAPLSTIMERAHEFPDQAIDMVMTGERSGNMDKMLDKMAEYYETEAAVAGKQTAMITGVVFYLAVAALVGIFVISFWVSYFSNIFSSVGE
jgi:type II secretory pathway component PulF